MPFKILVIEVVAQCFALFSNEGYFIDRHIYIVPWIAIELNTKHMLCIIDNLIGIRYTVTVVLFIYFQLSLQCFSSSHCFPYLSATRWRFVVVSSCLLYYINILPLSTTCFTSEQIFSFYYTHSFYYIIVPELSYRSCRTGVVISNIFRRFSAKRIKVWPH